MDWVMWVFVIILIAGMVAMLIFSSRRNKKQQEEMQNKIDAVKPGNKVKTIGGVCGIVVEVDLEDNSFVLETGSEATGKCYVKFDRQAIFQTDAVPEPKEEKPAEKKEDAPAEALPEENLTEPAPEAPAEEKTEEKAEE